MSTYNIKIVDSISDSIPKKLADISQQATKSSTSTAKLQKILNQSSAHNRFVTMQQRVAMSNARVATSANRTIGSLAKLETAQLRAAMAAQRAASKHSLASRSILIGSARIISAISRWMSLLGLGFSLKFITRFTDEFTNLENKLKNVTVSSANLARVNEEVFAAANRARVPVQELAQTYQRIDLAVKDLGFSQKEAMRITETASKALALSGATTGETAAALLQLSQAFNKGKLDGDEFRTVMELMPTAADAIAKQLGVTRGELLKLAPEGKITAKVMADAFQNVAKEVDDKFSKITPTISQALTVLRNNAVRAWGEFDKSVGITDKLSRAILTLSDNLDVLGKFAAGAGAGLVTYFGVTLVGAVLNGKSAVSGLWALISAHPLGALATAIGLVTAALVYNSDEIIVNQEKMITLRDYAVGAWNLIADNAKYAADAVVLTWRQGLDLVTKGWNNVSIEVKAALQSILQTAITVSKFIVNKQIATVDTIVSLWETLPAIMDGIWFGIADVAAKYVEQMITDFTGIFKLLDYVDKKMGGSGIDYGIDLGRDSRGTFSGTSREDAKAALTNAIETTGKNFNTNYVGEIAEGIRDGLEPVTDAFDEAARRAQADRINSRHAILSGKYNKDSYYDQARPIVPTSGDSAADKVKKGSKKTRSGSAIGVEPNAQNFAESCGKAMAAELINSHTGQKLKDMDIQSLYLIDEINTKLKEAGVNLKYIDLGNVNAANIEYAKKAMEKGYAVGFGANGPEFSPSGKGHAMVGQAFKGDQLTYMDPDRGRIRNTTFTNLQNAPSRPDGNFMFAPANIDSLPTRHKKELDYIKEQIKEAERLPKVYEKAKGEITKDTLMIIDSFKYEFDAAEEAAKGWKKYFEQKSKMTEYHQALKDETELVKMASDVAETHAQWLEYKNKFAEQATKLNEKEFKQIVDTNRELERQRQIREGILANSPIGRDKDFKTALNAGKDLEGKEKIAYRDALLQDFLGIDTSLLSDNLGKATTLWEDYYSKLSEMVKKGMLKQKDADELAFDYKIQLLNMGLQAVSQTFADLSSITKEGSKELIMISKAAAIAETIFSTYAAAQLAYKKGLETAPGGAGVALGVTFAAAAVAQGLARVAQIRAQGTEGYMAGGYTGNGPRSSVAGVVHGQEFVMNAQATQRIGVGNLQALQDGRSLQSYSPPHQQNNQSQPVVVSPPQVNVAIVSSKDEAYSAMRSKEGTNIVLQVIEENGKAVARMIS